MWEFFRKKGRPIPIETQVETLAACGVRLVQGRGADALITAADRAAFEADPYRLALTVMGSQMETGEYLSDDIWHFDTECIEDHGSYTAIAKRLQVLAKGDLPLQNVEDYVDIEEGTAWIAFRLEGQQQRWDAKVEDDWVDTTILGRFADLLTRRNTGRRFTYIDLGGQDCLVGCATAEEFKALRGKSGLEVDWLA